MSDQETCLVICDTEFYDTKFHDTKGTWKECADCIVPIYLSDSTLSSAEKLGYKRENLILNCFECAEPKIKESWEGL